MGIYYTIDMPEFKNFNPLSDEEIELISKKIEEFLPDDDRLVLVVGLGNRYITPDSLGPRSINKIIATRHVKDNNLFTEQFKHLRAVAAIAPGVLGQTGLEVLEVIYSLVNQIKPVAVIVIDALVSRNVNRLGCTIQLSNSGISPGSGVMNSRKEISQKVLGVPVVSIGIPTVVNATTLVYNIMNDRLINEEVSYQTFETKLKEKIEPYGSSMIVTPNEIDNIIKNASDLLSLIINKALQKNLSISEINTLSS